MNYIYRLLAFVFISLHLGCTEHSGIGTEFFEDNHLQISYSDTLSLHFSTLIMDSVATSNQNRLLVGRQNDQALGTVKATAYFGIDFYDTVFYYLGDLPTQYHSMSLVLEPDGYAYYNDAIETTLELYQLSERLELFEDGFLYNNTTIPLARSPIGQVSLRNEINSDEEIEFHISDFIGNKLYEMLNDPDFFQYTQDELMDVFKGFNLKTPDSTEYSIIGIYEPRFRLYYMRTDEPLDPPKYLEFQSPVHFSSISRENTFADGYGIAEGEVPSTLTGGLSYLGCGSGLGTKIEIPALKEILLTEQEFLISRSILELRIIKDSYSDDTPLINGLDFYVVNDNNEILGEVFTEATLTIDDEYHRDTYYTVDITDFIDYQLSINEINGNGLLILPDQTGYYSSVDRSYIGNTQFGSKLTLYTITKNIE